MEPNYVHGADKELPPQGNEEEKTKKIVNNNAGKELEGHLSLWKYMYKRNLEDQRNLK